MSGLQWRYRTSVAENFLMVANTTRAFPISRRRLVVALAAAPLAGLCSPLFAQDANKPKRTREEMIAKAVEYLRTKGQQSDGSFSASPRTGQAVTALVTTALLRCGVAPSEPVVLKSLKLLETQVQPDGSISRPNSPLQNYETSIAVMCFAQANRDGRYDAILKNADMYLKDQIFDEADGKEKSDAYYGGSGYGGPARPDLSNTSFLVEALKSTGNEADSQAIQKALAFVSRCQNLESEHNSLEFAAKNPDGGFIYNPIGEGSSEAGKTDNGGLRSYGSMTYAGLKSMIYAGLKKDDKRVKAAVKWLQNHYDLDSNPGVGQAGLYYYYSTLGKALEVMGETKITDAKGNEHDWRKELIAELAERQKEDGSWVNTDSKWMEGDANLVTGFALLTLANCKEPK
jgi:squalene-hopene/tetraprenyl-beta-curcumene cyclase